MWCVSSGQGAVCEFLPTDAARLKRLVTLTLTVIRTLSLPCDTTPTTALVGVRASPVLAAVSLVIVVVVVLLVIRINLRD